MYFSPLVLSPTIANSTMRAFASLHRGGHFEIDVAYFIIAVVNFFMIKRLIICYKLGH